MSAPRREDCREVQIKEEAEVQKLVWLGFNTAADVMKCLGWSKHRAQSVLDRLVDEGRIERRGTCRNRSYAVARGVKR